MKLINRVSSSHHTNDQGGVSMICAYFKRIVLAVAAALALPVLPASAIVLDAVEDIWIRQNSPTSVYQADFISVWGNPESDIRYGAVEFDLNSTIGETLNSVYLNLFDPGGSRSDTQPIVQDAYVLSTALPPSIDQYNWAEYETWDQANEVGFDSFGAYDLAVGSNVTGYNASAMGSSADIALLESVRDSNNGRVILILKASEGQRDWLDIESGQPPQLIFNQDPQVVGDLNGDGVVDADDLSVITDSDNWLQDVDPGTRGDLTGNGRVDLADFHTFKQIFQSHQGASAAVIPEPTTGVLLLLGGSLLLGRRFRA